MTVQELAGRLEGLRVMVWADGNTVRLCAEHEPPAEILEELRTRKTELLERLRILPDRVPAASLLTVRSRETGDSESDASPSLAECWPAESRDYVRRFGNQGARLYPFLGRRVETPEGAGLLLQVLETACAVRLDSSPDRVRYLDWRKIQPPRLS